jgi:hypothetical protein
MNQAIVHLPGKVKEELFSGSSSVSSARRDVRLVRESGLKTSPNHETDSRLLLLRSGSLRTEKRIF